MRPARSAAASRRTTLCVAADAVYSGRKKEVCVDRMTLTRLQDLPNVGPVIAAKLRLIGVRVPSDLIGRDPYALFDDLGARTGERHDPCLLDVFISATRFMAGEPARPWWAYTAERKTRLGSARKAHRAGSSRAGRSATRGELDDGEAV
jgi:hypothetical protein